jgi:tetratricopeptide (TPR) repeat protein
MDIGDCYRLLGLRSGASFTDIKASYRKLAQQYHPDINPGDMKAKEKFISLTEAYKLLLESVPQEVISKKPPQATSTPTQQKQTVNQTVKSPTVTNSTVNQTVNQAVKRQTVKTTPTQTASTTTVEKTQTAKSTTVTEEKSQPQKTLSEVEKRLKWKTYEQLQRFLREKRFPQAISLIEALAERLPEDHEIRQWQAICYQLWAKVLISEKELSKARIYLKKALKTDPNNKSLANEIQREFQRIEQLF